VRAWNSLPLETRACSSLLTFRRETKSHLFRQSYGWRGAVYSDGQQTSALSCATVLDLDFCKVPPQLSDGSTLIHDICSSSSSSKTISVFVISHETWEVSIYMESSTSGNTGNLLECNCSSWKFLYNRSMIDNWEEWYPVTKFSYSPVTGKLFLMLATFTK